MTSRHSLDRQSVIIITARHAMHLIMSAVGQSRRSRAIIMLSRRRNRANDHGRHCRTWSVDRSRRSTAADVGLLYTSVMPQCRPAELLHCSFHNNNHIIIIITNLNYENVHDDTASSMPAGLHTYSLLYIIWPFDHCTRRLLRVRDDAADDAWHRDHHAGAHVSSPHAVTRCVAGLITSRRTITMSME